MKHQTYRDLPPLAGLCTFDQAARPGLMIEKCVARLKRYHYAFKRLQEIFTARITAEPPMIEIVGTMLGMAVTAAFMIFRAPDMGVVANMTAGALGLGGMGNRWTTGAAILVAIAAVLALLKRPNPETVERFLRPHPAFAAATALAAVYVMVEVGRGAPSSFIYFQF